MRAQVLHCALNSRIVIEQAKSALARSAGVSVDEAFEIMRTQTQTQAQSTRMRLVDVGATLLESATFAGNPVLSNTGQLLRVNGDGTFTVIFDGLNQPSSMEIVENTACVVTLGGEIWTIESIS